MDSNGQKACVFVGLGNPGKKYDGTRHNIGFEVIDAYARMRSVALKQEAKFNAEVGKCKQGEVEIHLVKPLSYMNLSGPVVRRYLDYYKLDASKLVVVVDDVALPFGQLRLRLSGASGGHNGLKSVQGSLGTDSYARLKVGVGGSQLPEQRLEDYVLQSFTKAEQAELDAFIGRGAEALKLLETLDAERVMNEINIRLKPSPIEGKENSNDPN